MYELIKLSDPGFELKTDDIRIVRNVLDGFICQSCMKTVSELDIKDQDPAEIKYLQNTAKPDNYDELNDQEKVNFMLGTSCGAEFMLDNTDNQEKEETVNPSGPKKCLMIIDVQKGFINSSTKHIPDLVEKLQNNYEYVYAARFCNKEKSLFGTLINWHRFDKNPADLELAFSPESHVEIIDKSGYACIDESFLAKLKERGIAEVHICGVDTEICVTKCAADLFNCGIEPKVLAEYCGSNAGYESHSRGLEALARFIGGAQILKPKEGK